MKFEVYYEAVEKEDGGGHGYTFAVEYVFGGTRYAATGLAENVSDAYARIKEHRQEFRKELAAKKNENDSDSIETVSQTASSNSLQ